jgi:transposase InsO family protein
MMQKHGIQARGKRKFRVTTNDSKHNLLAAPNVLDRNFTVTARNLAWVGDFTYIATSEGWLFLAVVIDLDEDRHLNVGGGRMRPWKCRSWEGRKTKALFSVLPMNLGNRCSDFHISTATTTTGMNEKFSKPTG